MQWKLFFSHLQVTWCNVIHKKSYDHYLKMARYVWTEDETEFFVKLIKDKKITGILDSKQQRNATIYQNLEADMKEILL